MRDLRSGASRDIAFAARPSGGIPSEGASSLAVAESCVGTFFATLLLVGMGVPLVLVVAHGIIDRSTGALGPRGFSICCLVLIGWLGFDLPYNLRLWGKIRN